MTPGSPLSSSAGPRCPRTCSEGSAQAPTVPLPLQWQPLRTSAAPSPPGNVVALDLDLVLTRSHRQTFLRGANNYCQTPVLTSVILIV